MKNTIFIIMLCAVSAFAQFEISPPSEPSEPEGVVYCRGTQEVDENGNPIPDDPNCVPDTSTGGTSGGDDIEGWFFGWF